MWTVTVPATTSNLGPGYDVLGMALSLRNRFGFEPATSWMAEGRSIDPSDHLTLQTAVRAARHFGGALGPLAVQQVEGIPRARGMGSSATARVAGLRAALHFCDLSIPLADQLQFLSDEEGHPDNVVPAAVGGLTLCGEDRGLVHLRFDPPDFWVALCVPDFEVSTPAARALLPATVPHGDAVFNVSSVAFLLAGLVGGRPEAIRLGLRDRLHQPYRAPLIGPIAAAFEGAVAAGALGAFVSGSGSTLAALATTRELAQAAALALAGPFEGAATHVLRPSAEGARVEG